ncbi:MAG: hypothetical protein ACTSPV_12410 [Candidatus Hodarchaeales archaeon]
MTKRKRKAKTNTKESIISNKKSKEYKDLDYKQSKLKASLHENWRQYYKFRVAFPDEKESKAPITMAQMEKQQTEINKIRRKIGKSPISLIQHFKQTLKNLRSG